MHSRSTRFIITLCLLALGSALLVFLDYAKPDYILQSATRSSAYSSSNTTPEVPKPISVVITGDVMMAAEVGNYLVKEKRDPFQFVRQFMVQQDLAVINLETALATPGVGAPVKGKSFTFNAPLAALDSLTAAGIDVVSLANNHTMDYGAAALIDQMKLLSEKGIVHFGAGKDPAAAFAPKYVTVKDTTIAFIGINDIENLYTKVSNSRAGNANFDEARTKATIAEANAEADIVIAYPHWGVEHEPKPSARQRQWAHLLIDWGADLVVGAHPHVRQEAETYKGKKIYYSLGNFIFTGMGWDPESEKGAVLLLEIEGKKITKQTLRNVQITYHGSPKFVD